MGEAVDVARAEDKGAAQLKGIAAEFVLMVAGGLGAVAAFEIVAPEEVEEVGFAEIGEFVGLAVGVDEERKVDAGLLLKEAGVASVAEADGGEGGVFGTEGGLVFAQLRDMLATENSAVVAKEDEDGGIGFPEGTEADGIAGGVGEGDVGETLAKGVGHIGDDLGRRHGVSRRRWRGLSWRAFVRPFSLSGFDLIAECWPAGCRRYLAGNRICSRTLHGKTLPLKQAEMIGIFCLQGADQDIEGGEFAKVFEPGITEEKRPAGKTGGDTALEPFEGGVAAFEQGENARELIVAVVGMAERLGDSASPGEAVQGAVCFTGHGVINALEAGEERFIGEQLERFIEQAFRFLHMAAHHRQVGSKIEGIFVARIFGKPGVDFTAGEIKFALP